MFGTHLHAHRLRHLRAERAVGHDGGPEVRHRGRAAEEAAADHPRRVPAGRHVRRTDQPDALLEARSAQRLRVQSDREHPEQDVEVFRGLLIFYFCLPLPPLKTVIAIFHIRNSYWILINFSNPLSYDTLRENS